MAILGRVSVDATAVDDDVAMPGARRSSRPTTRPANKRYHDATTGRLLNQTWETVWAEARNADLPILCPYSIVGVVVFFSFLFLRLCSLFVSFPDAAVIVISPVSFLYRMMAGMQEWLDGRLGSIVSSVVLLMTGWISYTGDNYRCRVT